MSRRNPGSSRSFDDQDEAGAGHGQIKEAAADDIISQTNQIERSTASLSINMNTAEVNKKIPKTKTCPLADLTNKPMEIFAKKEVCGYHKRKHADVPDEAGIKKKIKLSYADGGFSYAKSGGSAAVLRDIGGGDKIRQMTTRFYARAFEDHTLDKFMFMTDGAANHGQRLGDWIVEKMGGEGTPWANSGRDGMRQQTHHQAWYSHKRHPQDRGKRFKLDDCRVWMRLMFWAAREVGLDKHEIFWYWYVQFIGHFIGIYEATAPTYAMESAEWSESPAMIDKYIADGCVMADVIGIGRR